MAFYPSFHIQTEERRLAHGTLHNIYISLLMTIVTSGLLLCCQVIKVEATSTRIVVLPGYVETGVDVSFDEELMGHYRRTMRFINNQLVRHGFEVINPIAKELNEKYYAGLTQRSSSTTKTLCTNLNQKYETDAAYIIWLDVYAKRTRDGFCRVTARIEGEGYDSSGRDLGAGLAKDFTTKQRDCVTAVEYVEKEIGDLVGRKLTAYQP